MGTEVFVLLVRTKIMEVVEWNGGVMPRSK